jgi:MFS family permease
VHKALDKSGAVLGPLVAYGLLWWLGETPQGYTVLFGVAFIPALLSVVMLTRIPDQPSSPREHEPIREGWRSLHRDFRYFLIPAAVFSLAYFSLAFLLLRAHNLGFSLAQTVLLYALFNTTCVITAPAIGWLGDRIGRFHIIMASYGLYGLINIGLVFADKPWELVALFAMYGVFYAMDESQSKAFIADLEPHRRATAVGAYTFITGLVYAPASLIAGALWLISPTAVFSLASGLSLLAILLLLRFRPSAPLRATN